MILTYKGLESPLVLSAGCVTELVIENKKLFSAFVGDLTSQIDGDGGEALLSEAEKRLDMSKYADILFRFSPFDLNRKPLLTKLCSFLEKQALLAENFEETAEILRRIETFVYALSEDLPFEVDCGRIAIGPLLRAVSPMIEDGGRSEIEKVYSYMELVRELDRDRLFITVNMRTYFSDREMEDFAKTVAGHDFRLLLLENVSFPPLPSVRRHTVDEDLCEF